MAALAAAAGNAPNPADALTRDLANLHVSHTYKVPAGAAEYSGSADDPPKEFVLKQWELAFSAHAIPKNLWAPFAASKLSPKMLHLFLGTKNSAESVTHMSWEAFCAAFKALNAGPADYTLHANLHALDDLAYDPSKFVDAPTALREVEAIFNRMTDKLPDFSQIHYVVKAMPGYLRPKITFTAEGSEFPTYAAFSSNLLAQASLYPARPPVNPKTRPNGQRGNRGNRWRGHGYRRGNGGGSGNSNGGSNGNGNGPCSRDFKRRGRPYQRPNQAPARPLSEVECHKCHQMGHYANNCPNRS